MLRPPGFTWVFFGSGVDFMYFLVIVFALSPFCDLFCVFLGWSVGGLGVFHAGRASVCLGPHLGWGAVLAPQNRFGPSSKIFLLTVPRRYFFCVSFVFFVLCLLCFCVCSLLPCGRMLGWGDLLTHVGDVYCIFVDFPCGIQGQVWYLIVSFPDFCLLS